jgi:hypothetical protein
MSRHENSSQFAAALRSIYFAVALHISGHRVVKRDKRQSLAYIADLRQLMTAHWSTIC